MSADPFIRCFDDLPSAPGRHELLLRVGQGRACRTVPVWWQRGEAAHPLLAITSLVHGDEFEGFAATCELWRRARGLRLCGSVLIIPLCNPWAAETATRTSPPSLDGGNLARSFPGAPRGTPTQKLAAQLWDFVRKADALVDFHSGGTGYEYAPLAGFYRAEDAALAACFPMPYLWSIPPRRGVLSFEFSRLGRSAVGCEFSGEARLNRRGVRAYVNGALAVMRRLDMVCGRVPPARRLKQLNLTQWQFTRTDGWFFTRLKIGMRVRKGDRIGTWMDARLRSRDIRSRHEGIVIGLRTLPRVPAGEALLLVGR